VELICRDSLKARTDSRCLDDLIAEDNPVRVVDAFVAELNLVELGFDRTAPARTGRPAYDPAVLLKVYIYGYLNRVQSSRRLEHECQRNVELMWLTGLLAPDFKSIADFRRDNGAGIRNVCRRVVVLCRDLTLFAQGAVAIDGSKFKAVNSRDRNFNPAKIDKRKERFEESIQLLSKLCHDAVRFDGKVYKSHTTTRRAAARLHYLLRRGFAHCPCA